MPNWGKDTSVCAHQAVFSDKTILAFFAVIFVSAFSEFTSRAFNAR